MLYLLRFGRLHARQRVQMPLPCASVVPVDYGEAQWVQRVYRVQEWARVSLRAASARAAKPHVSMRHAGVRYLLTSRWVRHGLHRRLVIDLHEAERF